MLNSQLYESACREETEKMVFAVSGFAVGPRSGYNRSWYREVQGFPLHRNGNLYAVTWTPVEKAADKPDYGLDEIPSLKNIKSRFESSETENGHDAALTTVHIKRSESIASKMAKFQGLESSENGHAAEDSSSSSDDDEDRDPQVVRSSKNKKEKPLQPEIQKDVVFSGMSQLKSQWETGPTPTKEERARERQEELTKLRQRICHGKGSMKAKYESACEESIKSPGRHEPSDLNGEIREIRTSSIKEKFEKGDVSNDSEIEKVEKILREKEEDLSVFREQGTANDARSLFKQIDASASKVSSYTSTASPTGNVKRSPSMRSREVLCNQSSTVTDGEVVRASDRLEDEVVPIDLSSKFKFFENYQDVQGTSERKRFTMTPPREPVKEESPEVEIIRDPNIVRACDKEEEVIVTDTARKMLNKFREMESKAEREEIPTGPKPLKRITPPREYTKELEGSPEPEIIRDPSIVRACDKVEDDFLIEAHKAKSLKEKFEHWDDLENDIVRENHKNAEDEILQPSPETAKNLKAKFEALQEESERPLEKPKSKINRFIDFGDGANGELCDICGKRVYTMEKLEVNGHKVHKTCFRCSYCGTILRMDNYTTSEGVLYCTPHFKQLFIARGNYDEGFGREQHKDRWNKNSRSSTPNLGLNEMQYANGDSSD